MALHRAIDAVENADAWIHCGDYRRDGERLAQWTQTPCYGVAGNCDDTGETERVECIDGISILITHGHQYRSSLSLAYRARELDCSVVAFGHSHMPLLERQGELWLVNPGSPARPRGGHPPSCAVMCLQDGQISIEMVRL